MPGRVPFSRNSNEAPPPVEIWVKWEISPSLLMAAMESPPPTTLSESKQEMNLARLKVPFANWENSKTPTGPFQKIEWAFLAQFPKKKEFPVLYPSLSSFFLCLQGF